MALPLTARRDGLLNGRTNAVVGPTAADVAHFAINFFIGRVRVGLQQRCGGHYLAGLAVAALGNVQIQPGLLQGMGAIRREAFDRHDLLDLGEGADGH